MRLAEEGAGGAAVAMRRRYAVMIVLAFVAVDVHPCTTFCMNVDGRVVFGENYDWDIRDGRAARP